MEGPSGCYPADKDIPASNGLIALYDGTHTLFFYAEDHSRFINRYALGRQSGLFGQNGRTLTAGFNLEKTAADVNLPSIYIYETCGKPLAEGLTACARRIADRMQARHVQPPAYHWCSWYYQYQNMSQETLEDYLSCFGDRAEGMNYIQLDAGYCRSLGDWLIPGARFPEGLKKASETITEAGFLLHRQQ